MADTIRVEVEVPALSADALRWLREHDDGGKTVPRNKPKWAREGAFECVRAEVLTGRTFGFGGYSTRMTRLGRAVLAHYERER